MIKKATDIVLKVKPVLLGIEHRYYYEGPCRFGKGEALEPGFDKFFNEENHDLFLKILEENLPEGVELLEPARITRTDNWENTDAMEDILRLEVDAPEVDVAFFASFLGVDDIAVNFGIRYTKPMIISPRSSFLGTEVKSAVTCVRPDAEVYSPKDWNQAIEMLEALRARKVIRNTNILLAPRMNSEYSYSSCDTFRNHDMVTKNTGCHFKYVSAHELIDDMSPAVPEGNHTTPGRKTWNIDEADMAEAERIADELIEGAEEVQVERKFLIKSILAYLTVRKHMEDKDCNAFTVPCPDVCSSRRLNENQFTFCLCHSLNMENGIPSACEFDANAALTQQALIAVSHGARPFMGNTQPLVYYKEKGEWEFAPFGPSEELFAELAKENPEGLYYMQHSVPNRCYHLDGSKGTYALRHFAFDQGFGAILRYDWTKDAGQVITVARFSPDGSKLLVGRAELVCGAGYDTDNCNGSIVFRVKDQADFWEKQCQVGNHMCMVYGDWTAELSRLCKVMGIEELVCY